jgi:hypothetical protein
MSVRGRRPAHNAPAVPHARRAPRNSSAKRAFACVAASREACALSRAFGCGLPPDGRSSPTDTTSVDARDAHQQQAIVRGSRRLSSRILRHHILWSSALRKFTNVSRRESFSGALCMWKSCPPRAVNHYRAVGIPRSMKCAPCFCCAPHFKSATPTIDRMFEKSVCWT